MRQISVVMMVMVFLFLSIGGLFIGESADVMFDRLDGQSISFENLVTLSPLKNTYMIEMRDGIQLATDVFRPLLRSSPHGSLLIRTPYNKDHLEILGIVFALSGWPTVIQDMRGRFASEGLDTVFFNDHTDGFDTLAWIANQSWSNGKIATLGLSALGIPQYLMAGTNPPELAGQCILMATPNLYKDGVFQGGQLRKSLVERWLEDQGSLNILSELITHENYSLDYWTNVSLEDNWPEVNVPAIHMGGWYDIFLQGIIDGFMGYQYQGGPGALGKSKLIIGPWTHVGFITREQGELLYPINSLGLLWMRLFHQMIHEVTMNRTRGYLEWPAISYYLMGAVDEPGASGNKWRYAENWPVPAVEKLWYFHADEVLDTTLPGDYESITYQYDPMDPVPTVGGQNLKIVEGPYDQLVVEDRADVVVFTSAELEKPYAITGRVLARLYVSSDCPDTDFTVKLTDVYPDGRSMLITDGILRMRNRNGTDHWEFMNPGEIYEVEVDLWSTAYVWNTGHRIRVTVSSSNYPRFLNNPNTIDGVLQNESYLIATNTLYFSDIYASAIILPEVEN